MPSPAGLRARAGAPCPSRVPPVLSLPQRRSVPRQPRSLGALTPPCCSKEPLPSPARSGPAAPGSSPAVPGAGAARAGPRWSSEPSPAPGIFGRAPSALPAEREEPLLSPLLGILQGAPALPAPGTGSSPGSGGSLCREHVVIWK